jgi:hypothetical protein
MLSFLVALAPVLLTTFIVYLTLFKILAGLYRRKLFVFASAVIILAPFFVVFLAVSSMLELVWVLFLTPIYGLVVLSITNAIWMFRFYCSAFSVLFLLQFMFKSRNACSGKMNPVSYEVFWAKHLRRPSFKPGEKNKFGEFESKVDRRFGKLKKYGSLLSGLVLLFVLITTMVGSASPNLRNPTFLEAKMFVASDGTNQHPYLEKSYTCSNFAHDFRTNALEAGYYCGVVIIFNSNRDSHALNCFNTTDLGLVFLEPQTDNFVTVEVGKPYPVLNFSSLSSDQIVEGFFITW